MPAATHKEIRCLLRRLNCHDLARCQILA